MASTLSVLAIADLSRAGRIPSLTRTTETPGTAYNRLRTCFMNEIALGQGQPFSLTSRSTVLVVDSTAPVITQTIRSLNTPISDCSPLTWALLYTTRTTRVPGYPNLERYDF